MFLVPTDYIKISSESLEKIVVVGCLFLSKDWIHNEEKKTKEWFFGRTAHVPAPWAGQGEGQVPGEVKASPAAWQGRSEVEEEQLLLERFGMNRRALQTVGKMLHAESFSARIRVLDAAFP